MLKPSVWYEGDDFLTFARVLDTAGYWLDTKHLLRYMEKPYNYQREHLVWYELGKPLSFEDENWEAFINALYTKAKEE